MNAVTVWLLISMPFGFSSSHTSQARPATVVESFATKQDCERVAKWIAENNRGGPTAACIDAKVMR